MAERRHKYTLYPLPDKIPSQQSSIPTPVPVRGSQGTRGRGNPSVSSGVRRTEETTNSAGDTLPRSPSPKSHTESEENSKKNAYLSTIRETSSEYKSTDTAPSRIPLLRNLKAPPPDRSPFDGKSEGLRRNSPKPSRRITSYTETRRAGSGSHTLPSSNNQEFQDEDTDDTKVLSEERKGQNTVDLSSPDVKDRVAELKATISRGYLGSSGHITDSESVANRKRFAYYGSLSSNINVADTPTVASRPTVADSSSITGSSEVADSQYVTNIQQNTTSFTVAGSSLAGDGQDISGEQHIGDGKHIGDAQHGENQEGTCRSADSADSGQKLELIPPRIPRRAPLNFTKEPPFPPPNFPPPPPPPRHPSRAQSLTRGGTLGNKQAVLPTSNSVNLPSSSQSALSQELRTSTSVPDVVSESQFTSDSLPFPSFGHHDSLYESSVYSLDTQEEAELLGLTSVQDNKEGPKLPTVIDQGTTSGEQGISISVPSGASEAQGSSDYDDRSLEHTHAGEGEGNETSLASPTSQTRSQTQSPLTRSETDDSTENISHVHSVPRTVMDATSNLQQLAGRNSRRDSGRNYERNSLSPQPNTPLAERFQRARQRRIQRIEDSEDEEMEEAPNAAERELSRRGRRSTRVTSQINPTSVVAASTPSRTLNVENIRAIIREEMHEFQENDYTGRVTRPVALAGLQTALFREPLRTEAGLRTFIRHQAHNAPTEERIFEELTSAIAREENVGQPAGQPANQAAGQTTNQFGDDPFYSNPHNSQYLQHPQQQQHLQYPQQPQHPHHSFYQNLPSSPYAEDLQNVHRESAHHGPSLTLQGPPPHTPSMQVSSAPHEPSQRGLSQRVSSPRVPSQSVTSERSPSEHAPSERVNPGRAPSERVPSERGPSVRVASALSSAPSRLSRQGSQIGSGSGQSFREPWNSGADQFVMRPAPGPFLYEGVNIEERKRREDEKREKRQEREKERALRQEEKAKAKAKATDKADKAEKTSRKTASQQSDSTGSATGSVATLRPAASFSGSLRRAFQSFKKPAIPPVTKTPEEERDEDKHRG